MNVEHLRHIDVMSLAITVERICADGEINVIRLYYGDDGLIEWAEATRREGLPPGEVEVTIRRRQP